MDAQQQLFSLMAAAEEHQKAAQTAIEGLTAERAAVAEERAALTQAVAALAGAVADVRTATAAAAPAIREAASGAIAQSVKESLDGASEVAAKALDEALRPIILSLSGAARAADKAEGKLSGAVASFGWKWAVVAAGAAAGGILAVLLAGVLSAEWQRHQVEQLKGERAVLLDEVAQLQAQAQDWAKRGGRAKLEVCGDQRRLCVRIDKTTGFGKDSDYFVLRGY
jgi:hypothetical protein